MNYFLFDCMDTFKKNMSTFVDEIEWENYENPVHWSVFLFISEAIWDYKATSS